MASPRPAPLLRLVYCAIGLVGISVLCTLCLVLGATLIKGGLGQSQFAAVNSTAQKYPLLLMLALYPPMAAWIWYCRTAFDRQSLVSLGLRTAHAFLPLKQGAVVGFLTISLLWSFLLLSGALAVHYPSIELGRIGLGLGILHLLGYAVMFLAVGIMEELTFRGYILHNLNGWLGWRGALWLQAIIFGCIHLANVVGEPPEAKLAAYRALPSLILAGVFFAMTYRKSGSLWMPIGFHWIWNFALGCLFSLPVSGIPIFHILDVQLQGPSWLTGGDFGAEGSLLLIPLLSALIIMLCQLPDHPQALADLQLLRQPVTLEPRVLPEIEEPSGPNRYRSRMGQSASFDAGLLHELQNLPQVKPVAGPEVRQESVLTIQEQPAPEISLEPRQIPQAAPPEIAPASPVSPNPPSPKAPAVTEPPPTRPRPRW